MELPFPLDWGLCLSTRTKEYMYFEYLDTNEKVLALIDSRNKEGKPLVIDLETTGLNPRRDKILQVVMSGGVDQAFMFPEEFTHNLRYLKRTTLIFHNFRFDCAFLEPYGLDMVKNHSVIDTMLLHHLLNENERHGLDALIQARYGDSYKELFWKSYKTYAEAPLECQLQYACKDVVYTMRLFYTFMEEFGKSSIPYSLIQQVHETAYALYKTEVLGVKVDLEYLEVMSGDLKEKIRQAKLDIRKLVDRECFIWEVKEFEHLVSLRKTDAGKARVAMPVFNIESNKQVGELLYETLQLPSKSTAKGNYQVDDEALQAINDSHPVVPILRKFKDYQKVYTAFIEGTYSRLEGRRVHPSFNVNGTVTGRLSSSNPNLQQLPRDGGVRGIYIPDTGHKLITCDYSQLEICLAAHFSQDPVLMELVTSGKSMHDHTAQALNIPRQVAKTINFLVIYGGTEYRLSKVLKCSIPDAKLYLVRLWETYKGLKKVIDECHEHVRLGIPIANPFGRFRRFPLETLTNEQEKQRACRQAFNSLVQGTGADITHRAFYTHHRWMVDTASGSALFEVHDEIVSMPKESCVKATQEALQVQMIQVGKDIGLNIPLSVDCSEAMERWTK